MPLNPVNREKIERKTREEIRSMYSCSWLVIVNEQLGVIVSQDGCHVQERKRRQQRDLK